MKSFKTSKKKIKTNVPRSFDEKYTGSEPSFSSQVVSQKQMADAYTYYNYHYDYTDSRKFLIAYMKSKKFDKAIVEKIQNLPDTFHVPTVGWIARILTRGAEINQTSQKWFDEKLVSLIQYTPKTLTISQPRKHTIQDRMNDQFHHCVSEIEEQIDLFFEEQIDSFVIKEYLSKNQISGPVAKRIVQHYQRLLEEYDLALERKNDQLKEAYSNIPKPKLKRMREFLVSMLEPLKSESKKVVVRTTRRPRVKTASQQVKKLRHMLSFKDLGINSVSPESIIGASQLWVYNVKTRKLGVYHSEGIAGLKVKGSTILAFDQKTSTSKKLRKPDKVLPTVVSGGKVALRTVLDNVKAVASQLTGRINNDTILLRTVK
jgi:hypothetical protein